MVKTNCCQEKAGCCCKRGVRIGLVSLGVIAVVSGIGAGLWYGYDHWVKESKTFRDIMPGNLSLALEQVDGIQNSEKNKKTRMEQKTRMELDDIKSGITGLIELQYGQFTGFEDGRKMVNAINETLESALVATPYAIYFNGDHEQLLSQFTSQMDVLYKLVANTQSISISNQSLKHCSSLVQDDLDDLKVSELSVDQKHFLKKKLGDISFDNEHTENLDMDDLKVVERLCLESVVNTLSQLETKDMDGESAEKVAKLKKFFGLNDKSDERM